jgi:hypothetical protein
VESLFAASLHISDFVQTQNEAKILTAFDFSAGFSVAFYSAFFFFSATFLALASCSAPIRWASAMSFFTVFGASFGSFDFFGPSETFSLPLRVVGAESSFGF